MYHFVSEQPPEPMVLSDRVQVAGHICQYLKPFQMEALRFMHRHMARREFCVLNDESGLGKSVATCVLLGALGKTKKSLIVVQNCDELVNDWQFHLDVLTSLKVTVLEGGHDPVLVALANVTIAKWSTLRLIDDFSKFNFDYVIIDNRGQMLSNNFCTSMLLHNYERKVNLLISSVDITSDVKLMYNVLRLGGRLESQFESFRAFEEKFKLPDCKDVSTKRSNLEEYFIKRKILTSYCKDFCLRRYRHQYESHLPLVDTDRYKISLDLWRCTSHSINGSQKSSEHTREMGAAPSDAGTEELFLQALELNKKVTEGRFERPLEGNTEIIDISDEPIVMSPLQLDSDSDFEDMHNNGSNAGEDMHGENTCPAVAVRNENNIESTRKTNQNKTTPTAETHDVYEFVDITGESTTVNWESRSRKATKPHSEVIRPNEADNLANHKIRSPKNADDTGKISMPPERNRKRRDSNGGIDTVVKENGPKLNRRRRAENENSSTRVTRARKVEASGKPATSQFKTKVPKTKSFEKNLKKDFVSLRSNKRIARDSQAAEQVKSRLREKPSNKIVEVQAEKRLKDTRKTPNKTERLNTSSSKKPSPTSDSKKTSELKRKRQNGVPNASTLIIPRTTRSMQRTTRSSEVSKNKYMTRFELVTERKSRKKPLSKPGGLKNEAKKPKKAATNKSNKPDHEETINNLPIANGAIELTPISILSSTDYDDIPCGQKLIPNTYVEEETPKQNEFLMPPTQHIASNSLSKAFVVTQKNVTQSDVLYVPPSHSKSQNVIVLSCSSSDDVSQLSSNSTQSRRTRALKQKKPPSANAKNNALSLGELLTRQKAHQNKANSPDIFSASNEIEIPFRQQLGSSSSAFEGFKIFGSEVKQQQRSSTQNNCRQLARKRSCLDLLDKIAETDLVKSNSAAGKPFKSISPPTVSISNGSHGRKSAKVCQPNVTSAAKKSRELIEEELFEITRNDTFGSVMRINSNGEVSPVQLNRSTPNGQHNKITNYLIGTTQLPSTEMDELLQTNSTPSKRGQLSGGSNSNARKSPKSPKSSKSTTQATKLTKWFSKNDVGIGGEKRIEDKRHMKQSMPQRTLNTRRRCLEKSFQN